jgi:hypothetical protein
MIDEACLTHVDTIFRHLLGKNTKEENAKELTAATATASSRHTR